jgi:hypothetical protein
MSKLPEQEEKYDEAREPTDHFVVMNHFVAEESDDESAGSNDDDSSPSWHVSVDDMDELSSDDYIDR